MNETITSPKRGHGLKADWGDSVARGINSLSPMSAARSLVRDGAGGVGAEPMPENRRDRNLSRDKRPWRISSDTREETVEGVTRSVSVRVFSDCYYMAGQIMLKYTPDVDEEAVEDFVCQGDLDEGDEYTADDRPFVAFRYVSGTSQSASSEEEIVGYKSYDLMLADMRDRTKTVIPLYLFTHDGGVKLDFRSIPSSQEFEIA